MNEKDLRIYHELYTNYWRLLKKYCNLNDSEEFLESLTKECQELNEQFEKKKFASDMTLAICKEIKVLQNKVNQEELQRYYEVYTECWKLFKKYCNPVDTDEFWQSFAKECRELSKKFGQKKFAINMILATYEEIGALQGITEQKGE